MSAEALFGEGQERAEFEQLASERAHHDGTTEDRMTPTILLSIMFCPALTALSYAYDC